MHGAGTTYGGEHASTTQGDHSPGADHGEDVCSSSSSASALWTIQILHLPPGLLFHLPPHPARHSPSNPTIGTKHEARGAKKGAADADEAVESPATANGLAAVEGPGTLGAVSGALLVRLYICPPNRVASHSSHILLCARKWFAEERRVVESQQTAAATTKHGSMAAAAQTHPPSQQEYGRSTKYAALGNGHKRASSSAPICRDSSASMTA
ncbi:uncharacterized protein BP5553_02835 [Venustampulla echinocandica]|uniref:Uncharacterized protein n=1 Tax=Venustampulla echinocandica TaxID=2656787 RepID=A0A370TSI3_9HELO|nr:uncharacterized protein BP5553_02835 [Venustampulla echinocandica]RDL38495.1 hypothetical protein BP5553_02835 [Venustampulla echinocandica]